MSRHKVIILLAVLLNAPLINAQASLAKAIYFKPGQYQLDPAQLKTIDAFLNQFDGKQPGFLKIAGYTDTTGIEPYNDRLSDLRSIEVFNYIKSKMSINEKLVYVTSLGESADVYDLHFPGAHAQQRCVDIWFEK